MSPMKNDRHLFKTVTDVTKLRHLRRLLVAGLIFLPLLAEARKSPDPSPTSGEDPASAAAPAPMSEPVQAPPPPPPPSATVAQPAPSLRRVYVQARPFYDVLRAEFGGQGIGAGALLHAGVEHNGFRGLWIGGEISPLSLDRIGIESAYPPPTIALRLTVGYSGDRFGVAANLGSTFRGNFATFTFGPTFRVGRFTETHARLRVSWSLAVDPNPSGQRASTVLPYPSGDLELNIKVTRRPRVWLQLVLGGEYVLLDPYASLGVQILLHGKGGPGSDLLTVGLGFFLSPSDQFALGPLVTVGYEHRF
jgi:hypothetical protein